MRGGIDLENTGSKGDTLQLSQGKANQAESTNFKPWLVCPSATCYTSEGNFLFSCNHAGIFVSGIMWFKPMTQSLTPESLENTQ